MLLGAEDSSDMAGDCAQNIASWLCAGKAPARSNGGGVMAETHRCKSQ
jgi:hypothetical protein